jgi:hypothetical protein
MLIQNQDFYYFIKQIVEINYIKSIDDLYNLLTKHSKNFHKNYNINISIYSKYNMAILHTFNIEFNIGDLDNETQMIHDTIGTCIISNDNLKPIIHINKKFKYDYRFLNSISKKKIKIKNIIDNCQYLQEKDKIEFYKSYDGEHIVLFCKNNIWFLLINNKIYNYNNKNNYLLFNLFKNLFEETSSINYLKHNIAYHFNLTHHLLGKCIYDIRLLIHLYSVNMETLLRVNENVRGIIKSERIYLSCKDELLDYLCEINNKMINKGKLTQKGIIMSYYNPNYNVGCENELGVNSDEIFEIYFDTELYQKISSKIKLYKNIYQSQLVMYINNECNDILPYITSNHSDIVKRINNSLKTISKELLDIYFVTNKKNNIELYNVLPKIYRDIKFNIHGIFIKKRKNDYYDYDYDYDYNNDYDNYNDNHYNNDNDNDHYYDDDIQFKSSVELNDVYLYIKNSFDGEKIIELYYQRKNLINNIINKPNLMKYKSLFNFECSYTILQNELMFNL